MLHVGGTLYIKVHFLHWLWKRSILSTPAVQSPVVGVFPAAFPCHLTRGVTLCFAQVQWHTGVTELYVKYFNFKNNGRTS